MRATHCLIAILLVLAGIQGCTWNRAVPAYLVNESGRSLKVGVSMPGRLAAAGDLSTCRFDPQRQPMTMGRVEELRQPSVLSWVPVSLMEYDADKCTATIEIPPGNAVLMYWDGSCSDHGDSPSKSRRPTIDRLQVSDGTEVTLLEGAEAAQAFRRSQWHRDCTYEIR